MKLLDKLMSVKSKDGDTAPAASPAPEPGNGVADLWFSLCDDPNQQDRLPELLTLCAKKGGPAASRAALGELAGIKGSWLPQLYLGRSALEQKDIAEASKWYGDVLGSGEPSEFALFMISADMGRFGYAIEMPDLLAKFYDPDKHNVYIGLNLLQAYKESGRKEEGRRLLRKVKRKDTPEIHDYLEGFEADFTETRGTPGDLPEENTSDAPDTPAASQDDRKAEAMPESAPKKPAERTINRPVMVNVPVWSYGFPALQDLLPLTIDKPRVGLYIYSDMTPAKSAATVPEGTASPSDLAVSLPLYLGERLLFTTNYAPLALFPIDRETGPRMDGLEPDVQSLFSLCSREALDYLITGTISLENGEYKIRSWVIDRSRQNARIVAKNMSVQAFGEPFLDMVNEILLPFGDRRQARGAAKSDFLYAAAQPDLVFAQLYAGSLLLQQYLVQQNECVPGILPDPKKALDSYACLAGTDPKNQMYMMILLSGMRLDKKSGSDMYKYYRQLLYDVADRNRMSPAVKATMPEINVLLVDPE